MPFISRYTLRYKPFDFLMLPQLQKEAKSKKRINERGVRDDVKPNWMKALKARMTYNAIICFLTILRTGWGDKKK